MVMIGVYNEKGGVGKTTICYHLYTLLEERIRDEAEWREIPVPTVRAFDFDRQGGMVRWIASSSVGRLDEIFMEKDVEKIHEVLNTCRVIWVGSRWSQVLIQALSDQVLANEFINVFSRAIKRVHFGVIDLPANLNFFTGFLVREMIHRRPSAMIVPFDGSYLSLEPTMASIRTALNLIGKAGLVMVLPNRIDRTRVTMDAIKSLREALEKDSLGVSVVGAEELGNLESFVKQAVRAGERLFLISENIPERSYMRKAEKKHAPAWEEKGGMGVYSLLYDLIDFIILGLDLMTSEKGEKP